MITIKRTGGDPLGVSQYQLSLNDQVLAESFDHNRPDDLPTLLRKAADAVTAARMKHGDEIYQTKKPSYNDAVITAEDVVKTIIGNMQNRKEQLENDQNIFDPFKELEYILDDLLQFTAK